MCLPTVGRLCSGVCEVCRTLLGAASAVFSPGLVCQVPALSVMRIKVVPLVDMYKSEMGTLCVCAGNTAWSAA